MGELLIQESVFQAICEAHKKAHDAGFPTYRLGVARERAFAALLELWQELEGREIAFVDHRPWFHVKDA